MGKKRGARLIQSEILGSSPLYIENPIHQERREVLLLLIEKTWCDDVLKKLAKLDKRPNKMINPLN